MNPPAPDTEQLRNALRHVIDPENGVNIVDLGLVYGIDLAGDTVKVTMTMTSPACPMSDMILDDVDRVLADALPAGWLHELSLVWEPPWEPARMSDAARAKFGW